MDGRTPQRCAAAHAGAHEDARHWLDVQDAMCNSGDAVLTRDGAEAVRRMPPVVTASRIGVAIGVGTDAHRVSTYNPFTVLQWLLDGRTAGGTALRGPGETPSRAEVLRVSRREAPG